MTTRVDLDQLAADIDALTRRYTEDEGGDKDGKHTAPGLLLQLMEHRGRVLNSTGGTKTSRPKPGSRPPSPHSVEVTDLLALIEAAVWAHDADLRDLLDAHVNYERPWLPALQALALLAGRAGGDQPAVQRLARDVRSWRNHARLLLSYTVPMTHLQVSCPYCQQESLIVRADASSDVFCTTDDCTDERGEKPKWNRHNWILLLDQRTTA